jgi:hypothetical protein
LDAYLLEHLVVDHSITAIDCAPIKAKDHVGHKSSIKKGVVPCPDIDTDTRWGHNTQKVGLRYKLQMYNRRDGDISITANVTTVNVQDNQTYAQLTSSLVFSLPYIL